MAAVRVWTVGDLKVMAGGPISVAEVVSCLRRYAKKQRRLVLRGP